MGKMRKLLLTIGLMGTALGLQASLMTAQAAELGVYKAPPVRAAALAPGCFRREVCGPEGCFMKTTCHTPCPDRYSCAPLYGAYGPYGGTGYWGAYTQLGWGRY